MAKVRNCTIYMVRHGETALNALRIFQGNTDVGLNDKGQDQAKKLAAVFKPIKFQAIFSSDLLRAKQTAEILSFERKLVVTTHKALRERSLGKFDGKPITEYETKLKKLLAKVELLSDAEKVKFQFPDGLESYGSVISRVLNFLRQIAVAYPGKTVLMVTHGGVIRHTLVHLGYCTYAQLPAYSVNNLGYFKMETDGVEFFVKEVVGVNLKNG